MAAHGGSAEKALRPSMLMRRACSFDFVRSCLGFRAFCVTEDFRGRGRWIGGSVDDLPGGERASMDGRSSRGCEDWYGGTGFGLKLFCKGGSSSDLFKPGRTFSVSERFP